MEILDSFRPSLKTIQGISEAFRLPIQRAARQAGIVNWEWVLIHGITPGRVDVTAGEIYDLDDPGLRRELEEEHADFLIARGVDRLDVSVIRSSNRDITQRLGRSLYDRGAAGILFGSNIDGRPCLVLFEARARLQAEGACEPLAGLLHELAPALDKLGLTLAWKA